MSKSRHQPDKDGTSFVGREELSGRHFQSFAFSECYGGRRRLSRSVKGAKKFINSRRRFWEKMSIRKGLHEEEP